MPMGMPPPGMGAANPANLQQLAAAGDPRAIAALQQMQAAQGAGGMPPMQGAQPAPGMSQSDFSGYGNGQPIPPDVQARRAQQLIQLLRQRGQ